MTAPDPPSVGIETFEVTEPASVREMGAALTWREIALLDGVPVAQFDIANPGSASTRLVEAILHRRAMYWQARTRLVDDVVRRLGLGDDPARPPADDPSVSVIVCTHRRPEHLPRVIAALSALDPAPAEIIVVDNDPGEQDCRDAVTAAGFIYFLEPRRGLDNARNAGLRVASSEIVAFTDDDCAPSRGWLAPLAALFADPTVAAVTGPMFPYRLETLSQQRMETAAGMGRGFETLTVDWQTLSVAHATAVGVGANMSFRRAVLEALGPEPFPPELDAGTPTESGGDTYVLARLLADNHRLVYCPAAYGFHDHRGDDAALDRAVRGYGVGISAAMTKLLAEDGELEAWRGWTWLVVQYIRRLVQYQLGRIDREDLRLSRQYIAGGLHGPSRWRSSRRTQLPLSRAAQLPVVRSAARQPALSDPPPVGDTAADSPQQPQISVVIPTGRFGRALARCLASLATQTLAPDAFEVIVVDDRPSPDRTQDAPLPQLSAPTRILTSNAAGASAARNLGAREARAPIVLFLDDDMVAAPELLARHLIHHEGRELVAVIGSYYPFPPDPGLAARAVALWWSDHLEGIDRSARATFVWLLSGNLSVPRDAFLDVGAFSDAIPFRREDWEFGLRWAERGYRLHWEPSAAARHEFSLSTASRLRGAELEGFGDAMINRMYPGTAGGLPLIWHRPLPSRPHPRAVAHALLRARTTQRIAARTLDALESHHLRGAWLRLLRPFNSTSYKQGLERAGFRPDEVSESLVDCELLSSDPIAVSGVVAPTVRVLLDGVAIGVVRPVEGLWIRPVADQVASWLSPAQMERVGVARGWLAPDDPPEATPPHRPDVRVLFIDRDNDGSRWLDEALVAFDGSKVGAVFGSGVTDERPTQPIYLHDRRLPPAIRAADAPTYVLARTEALAALQIPSPEAGTLSLADALAVVGRLLADDWTVARRDVHGLPPIEARPAEELGYASAMVDLAGRKLDVTTARRFVQQVTVRAAIELRRTRNSTPLQEARGALRALRGASHRPDLTESARSRAR